MRRSSTSDVLLTRKALCPDGIMWRVFLLEPKPICILISPAQLKPYYALNALEFQAKLFASVISTTATFNSTYRWHNHLSLETSSDTVINTLRLSPACVDTFVGIALMSVETLGACNKIVNQPFFVILSSPFHSQNSVPTITLHRFQAMQVECRGSMRGLNVRFLTIGTCFLAETI